SPGARHAPSSRTVTGSACEAGANGAATRASVSARPWARGCRVDELRTVEELPLLRPDPGRVCVRAAVRESHRSGQGIDRARAVVGAGDVHGRGAVLSD